MSDQAKWNYSYAVWPDETWGHPRAMFKLFNGFGMYEYTFTEAEFEMFRSELSRCGITLREVSRTPYHEPEIVL